jgi:hypothetical protein
MSVRFQRAGDVSGAHVGESLLMMSVEKGQYFSLNGVGARVWELLEHPTTERTLVESLAEEYEVTLEDCASQVVEFLSALREYDLLLDVA